MHNESFQSATPPALPQVSASPLANDRQEYQDSRDSFWIEKGQISNFERLVTLTLDGVILYTVVRHLSTSTYLPNFIEIKETCIEIKETFCGRTDVLMQVRTYGQTDGHLRPALLGRLCVT